MLNPRKKPSRWVWDTTMVNKNRWETGRFGRFPVVSVRSGTETGPIPTLKLKFKIPNLGKLVRLFYSWKQVKPWFG